MLRYASPFRMHRVALARWRERGYTGSGMAKPLGRLAADLLLGSYPSPAMQGGVRTRSEGSRKPLVVICCVSPFVRRFDSIVGCNGLLNTAVRRLNRHSRLLLQNLLRSCATTACREWRKLHMVCCKFRSIPGQLVPFLCRHVVNRNLPGSLLCSLAFWRDWISLVLHGMIA